MTDVKKDVIYIDVEDDITDIIGKVKASREKVVALVPPKRIGVLQSAVNLRLLNRAAKQGGKHLALVTGNQSLIALATAASIPVAKNLQSAPELAEVPALAVDDGDDIIDGKDLPVGDHAGLAEKSPEESKADMMAAALAEAPGPNDPPVKPKARKGAPKVPNFNTFRKRLILIAGGVILLLAFLIWAIFFAPRATVVISAKTSSESINQQVTLSTTGATSLDNNTIKAVSQSKEEDKTVDFMPTGKKDAGSKATGTVSFSTNQISNLGMTIPGGTKLQSSSGLVFTTDSSVTITTNNYQGAPVGVTAAKNGSEYNAATGSMSGAPSGISASLTNPTSGGVTKTETVVTADDIDKAKKQITDDGDNAGIMSSLKSQFGSDAIPLNDSFTVNYSNVSSSPDVGAEGTSAKLSVHVTYILYGVAKSEISTYLDDYLKKDINNLQNQRIYKNGSSDASFQDVSKAKNGAKATLIATAQIGPKIDDNKVKDEVKGKRFGDIQSSLQSIQGVDNVDVKFFPFWVNTVPNNPSRITVEFKLDESK